MALAPAAAAVVGGATEQPATGKQEDDYYACLEGLSTPDRMQYRELEKRLEKIVRPNGINGELRSELLISKMKTKFLKLLEQMNDIIDRRDQGTSRAPADVEMDTTGHNQRKQSEPDETDETLKVREAVR